jgi:putative ABC transport system permease protein
MEQLLADDTAAPRFYMVLLGAYGVLALALTTLGIGGLVAYSVSRRTQEIGLRISFGATGSNLLWMFASASFKLVALRLVLWIPTSFVVTRFTYSLLYEVTPTDPTTCALVAALLTCVSLAACTTVAFRATTIEPTTVLRHD